jgi:hypothetical protein
VVAAVANFGAQAWTHRGNCAKTYACFNRPIAALAMHRAPITSPCSSARPLHRVVGAPARPPAFFGALLFAAWPVFLRRCKLGRRAAVQRGPGACSRGLWRRPGRCRRVARLHIFLEHWVDHCA